MRTAITTGLVCTAAGALAVYLWPWGGVGWAFVAGMVCGSLGGAVCILALAFPPARGAP